MKFVKRMLMVAGAVALAGLMGVMIASRAAHGIVAAMVQVVNTTANPVLTGEVMSPYQQSGSGDCIIPNECSVNFPTVTEETLILHPSCDFALASTASVALVSLATSKGEGQTDLQVFKNITGGGFTDYGASLSSTLSGTLRIHEEFNSRYAERFKLWKRVLLCLPSLISYITCWDAIDWWEVLFCGVSN